MQWPALGTCGFAPRTEDKGPKLPPTPSGHPASSEIPLSGSEGEKEISYAYRVGLRIGQMAKLSLLGQLVIKC